MKKLLLLLAAVGAIFSACQGGLDNKENNGNPTEQPGGGNQGGEEIPADKTKAIKFQDENAKLICILHWDENGDGEFSYEEAASVTDLDTAVKGSSILAFTELKYFTSLKKIADNAFEGCVSLVKTTLPEQITSIGTSAFNGCTNLKKITIPNAVTSIGYAAFADCTSLTSVTIPDSVTSVGDDAFSNCTSLTDTYVNITDLATYATGNNTYRFPGNKHLFVNGTEIAELVIPNSVTSIGERAFYNCTSLTSVIIPDSVTSIGERAFEGCTSLTSVTIGNGVTSIGEYAFYECSSLTSVTIGNSITSIGYAAFSDCTSLKEVYCKPTTPPAGSYYMFGNNASERKIYVPTNSVSAYRSAKGWSEYASYIEGYDF